MIYYSLEFYICYIIFYIYKKNMQNFLVISQIIISLSIIIVWVFRHDNIVLEFKQYGLSNLL